MKKIFLVSFSLFILPFVVSASPQDYPPTAFQFAQIHHYVTKKAEIDQTLNLLYKASEANALLGEAGEAQPYLAEVEFLLKAHIADPREATRAEWSSLIDILLPVLTCEGMQNTLSASFLEPGVKEIILTAIMAEQKAMKEGHVVVWRASGSEANLDQQKLTHVVERFEGYALKQEVRPCYLSFSHGLFSGFIFDGHTHQRGSSYSDNSACTYTYFSAFLCHRRMVREGARGLSNRLQTSFPDYFSTHKDQISACHRLNSMMDGMSYLDKIKDYYSAKNGDEAAEVKLINDQFLSEVALIWNLMGGIRIPPCFHLYGVVMTKEALARKSHEAEATGDSDALDAGDQRGEFFRPEYAVYGRGETFHPKLIFPQEGSIIKLFDYSDVAAAGAASADTTS